MLTADTCTSVLPQVAHAAAEKVATLIVRAGCLVPGPRRHRRRQTKRARRRARSQRGQPLPYRSRAHPARQIGHLPQAPSANTQLDWSTMGVRQLTIINGGVTSSADGWDGVQGS